MMWKIKTRERWKMSKELQTLRNAPVWCLESLTEDVIHQPPHTPWVFLKNMHAHFNKCEFSRQSKSAAHPLSPQQPGVGTLPPCRGACQPQHLCRTAFHPPPKENEYFYIYKYIYISLSPKSLYISCWDINPEETKVWWIEQRAWGSVRPLSSYSEGTESLPFAAKLCSVVHSLVLQRECFKVYNRAGKKSHTKTWYERWVGSDVVTPAPIFIHQWSHTSTSVSGNWTCPWWRTAPKPNNIRNITYIKLFLFQDAIIFDKYWYDPWTPILSSLLHHSECHDPSEKANFSIFAPYNPNTWPVIIK